MILKQLWKISQTRTRMDIIELFCLKNADKFLKLFYLLKNSPSITELLFHFFPLVMSSGLLVNSIGSTECGEIQIILIRPTSI